jgi:hypothetical protein
MQITRFSITALHDAIDVDVPIEDGKIILVGVNGLGKTTIVSMLYYFLTRQWPKLLEYEFTEIGITLDGVKVHVARESLIYPDWQQSLFDSIPASFGDRLRSSKDFQQLVRLRSESQVVRREDVSRVARKLELPISIVERAFLDSIRYVSHGVSKKQRRTNKALQDVEAKLADIDSQILYLPTYRRIEQDIKSIFPELEGEFRKAVKNRVSRDSRAGFVELVEFGMEDVEQRVQDKVLALKDGSRVELNNLAGGYLRDVIRGDARQWSGDKIKPLSDREVKLILGRVEEKQLEEQDKNKVFEVINRIREDDSLDGDQHLLAHFFSKLVAIHESQQEAEVPLRLFIDVCNRYLQAKKFEFDDTTYELNIRLDTGPKIEMRNLSSGEKQIVSLFAHIYLGDSASYFVIIDEPELSLSVEWQQRLLTDVIDSGRCAFMVAVTHSPFIYDNSLIGHAKDLAELQSVKA